MELEELQQLIRWLEAAGIGSFEIESADRRLRLSLQHDEVPTVPSAVVIDRGDDTGASGGIIVAAEVPGTFLLQHPMSATPFVPLGGRVCAGDIVGLVQVGPLYAPVTAPGDGSLGQILAAPETHVGYGTPLFAIHPLPAAE